MKKEKLAIWVCLIEAFGHFGQLTRLDVVLVQHQNVVIGFL
jgi:hypothetical protein